MSKNVGYFLLKVMIDSLSIDSELAMMTSKRKFLYGFSSFLRAMIYAQVIDPRSKLMASERVIPNLYGCESFSYDQILDGVTYIGSDYQKFIELFNRHIHKQRRRGLGLSKDKRGTGSVQAGQPVPYEKEHRQLLQERRS